jgi:GrpB-like predicted nucleotidyltransferase (UPF0157 family)
MGSVPGLAVYDPRWVVAFEREATLLRPVFGDALVAFEHIGSTAVPGIAAKPILDVVALVREKPLAESFIGPLVALGYADRTAGSTERRFLIKDDSLPIHLSIAYADFSRFFERQLLFRDYLRQNAEARRDYELLKTELMRESPGEDVSGGKTDFVVKTLKTAGFDETAGW